MTRMPVCWIYPEAPAVFGCNEDLSLRAIRWMSYIISELPWLADYLYLCYRAVEQAYLIKWPGNDRMYKYKRWAAQLCERFTCGCLIAQGSSRVFEHLTDSSSDVWLRDTDCKQIHVQEWRTKDSFVTHWWRIMGNCFSCCVKSLIEERLCRSVDNMQFLLLNTRI